MNPTAWYTSREVATDELAHFFKGAPDQAGLVVSLCGLKWLGEALFPSSPDAPRCLECLSERAKPRKHLPASISQMGLVSAILAEIDRQNPGCTGTEAIYAAVARAADQIVSAIRESPE